MNKNCSIHLKESTSQLKTGGLKVTSARLNLLELLKHAKKPASVKEIAKSLGEVDVVTLYRNIESLENLGLVRKINLNARQAYYELTLRPHHHHVVCTNCGRLEDIQIKEKALNIKTKGFAKITNHSLKFFGICNCCDK